MAQGPAVLVPKVSLAAMKHEVSAQYQTCSSTCPDLFSKTLVFLLFLFLCELSTLQGHKTPGISNKEMAIEARITSRQTQGLKAFTESLTLLTTVLWEGLQNTDYRTQCRSLSLFIIENLHVFHLLHPFLRSVRLFARTFS